MSAWRGVLAAFVVRDLRIALTYRVPFVLDLFVALFDVVLFFFLAKGVDPERFGGGPELERGYFAFVVLGLGAFSIAQTGLGSIARRLREEQLAGTFEVLLAAPVRPAAIVLGTAAYDLIRASVIGAVTIVVAILAFDLRVDTGAWPLAAAAVAFLGATALFTALGVLAAAFIVVFKQGQGALGIAIAVTSLLSGVYYPVEVLPQPLETVGELLPITWALDVLRDCLIRGVVDAGRLSALLAAAAAALPLSIAAFAAALDRARAKGSLGQY